jgi:hypothetical protein
MNRRNLSRHPRRKTLALVVAGIAGTGLLATGVASAATSATSSPASSSTADITTASLSVDGSAGSSAATGKLAAALKEIRQELKGGTVSGEVTVDTKKGPQTIEFQRGVVAQSSTASFTVTDTTGATDSWSVGPKMKVRDRGARRRLAAGATSTPATVTDGETVIVVGLKTDATSTARIVVVLPHARAGKSSTTPNSTTPSTNSTALQS